VYTVTRQTKANKGTQTMTNATVTINRFQVGTHYELSGWFQGGFTVTKRIDGSNPRLEIVTDEGLVQERRITIKKIEGELFDTIEICNIDIVAIQSQDETKLETVNHNYSPTLNNPESYSDNDETEYYSELETQIENVFESVKHDECKDAWNPRYAYLCTIQNNLDSLEDDAKTLGFVGLIPLIKKQNKKLHNEFIRYDNVWTMENSGADWYLA
jgi:hypothetical protein